MGDRITLDERIREPDEILGKTYRTVLSRILQIRDNIMIERKESEEGNLLAFCVDWRLSRDWDEAKRKAIPILNHCKEQGLYVVESEVSPFGTFSPCLLAKVKHSTNSGLKWA